MGARKYRHFSIEERCEIARRSKAGQSIRQVAAALDRSPSSVARELERNAASGSYAPTYATEQAHARRWKGSKLLRKPQLQAQVLELLRRDLSPEAVAARLALEQGKRVISHESIYRFIYAQIARTKNYAWRRYLPRGKAKRGYRGRKGGSSALHIVGRVPIADRPPSFSDRANAGHWEADSMQFFDYRTVLALHERSSRLIWLQRQSTKQAAGVATAIHSLLAPLPKSLRQSITFDNGTEFAQHHVLRKSLGIKTYFCDPYKPWQKGGVENAIGRLPRKTDLATVSSKQLQQLAALYNHTPRKCLDWQTPAEVFSNLLHFKRESTSPPSRGRRLSAYQNLLSRRRPRAAGAALASAAFRRRGWRPCRSPPCRA
jgi:transposase, IS30 family